MLHLLLSPERSDVPDEIFRRMAAHPERPQLLLVPEQYSHEAERRLCQVGGNRAAAWAEVLSFTQLSRRVFSAYGGSAAPVLDPGGRVLLMALAVRALAGTLRAYARPARQASFLQALVATADECKSCCILPETLVQAGEELAARDGGRLRELGLLLGAYDGLTRRLAEDPRDRLTRLAQSLAETDFLAGKDVSLACFTDFTPQEQLVLAQMLRKCRSVTVALRCDTLGPDGQEIFSAARRTALALTELAGAQGTGMEYEVLPPERETAPALSHLGRTLFAPEEGAQPWPEAQEEIQVFRASDPYEEVCAAAEEILRLAREEGFRYRDITVSARSLAGYEDLIETVFARYGIPVFLSRMEDILQKPVMALLTAALD